MADLFSPSPSSLVPSIGVVTGVGDVNGSADQTSEAPPARLLVVDDEEMLLDMVSDALRFAGYDVSTARNGHEAVRQIRDDVPDLVILDVNMPGDDGFAVAGKLQDVAGDLPLLFLTARSDTADMRLGFEAGGDDYLTKPFRLEELRLRVDAILRRTRKVNAQERVQRCADLVLDDARHEVRRRGEIVTLTPTEYRLLRHLFTNQGIVVGREQLLDAVWGPGYNDAVLETAISQLRKKVDAVEPKLVQTVRGFGYSLRAPSHE